MELGFTPSQYNQSLYVYRHGNDTCIIWLHMDNGAVMGSSDSLLQEISGKLGKQPQQ
ncbi:hypothetical protein CROQUDRAFT_101028 [Cronartium quercuum f. sp. fusiforme G11]|uniref:Uncharacterized protein n=1 Tax=Cronartium quercuum f. sp. fusiforme G11 TaxID=708437 RepID=A0A9P6N5P9_9BASI|nr:hypothetical protein CROQUDRAFT_101028 [Cronartium quercuum f. sp. fusiforme G11]